MDKRGKAHLISLEMLIKKGKWDEYCALVGISGRLRKSVKKYPNSYKGCCMIVSEKIADKLDFIY